MVLTADNKGRLTCRELFPPNAVFEATRDPSGKVTLVQLKRQEGKRKVVRPVAYKGFLMFPMEGAELDAEVLSRDIQEERDESLLG